MGMCVVKGPRVLHGEEQVGEQVGDGELSPRSTASSGSYGSAAAASSSSSSLEEEIEVAEYSSVVSPLWQRTIPKGRRCKPLSFSGMIVYDENGNQVEVTFEEDEDDEDEEYFSPQPRNLAEEAFRVTD